MNSSPGHLEELAPVSVILPVRNRPELLKEALSSVLQGTVWPGEILIIGNGTGSEIESDRLAVQRWKQEFLNFETSNQADPVSAKPPGIQFQICSGRPGPASARNLGARLASKKYLAFLDSDDLWKPEKLEKQLVFLSKRPHLKACHSHEQWVKNGAELHVPLRLKPATGRPLQESLETCLISASSLIIEREHFLQSGSFDERFPACEDYEFWIRNFLQTSMGCIQEPLVIKRSGPWSQVSTAGGLDLHRLRALLLQKKGLLARGLGYELQKVARNKARVLMQKDDAMARRADRLLRAIVRDLDSV